VLVRSAAELPPQVIDAFIREMARRMSGTPEARACAGLSFTFISCDVDVPPARYDVGRDGVVRVRRGDELPATFTFAADAQTFDDVLRGRSSAMVALLRRHIRLNGSLRRVSALLRMMPAVYLAYAQARERMVARYDGRYDFAF
jgi:hypothetical protein